MSEHRHAEYVEGCYRCDLSEDEISVVSLDEWEEEPVDDTLRNADWTGLTDDFDGESLIDNLLSGDTE